MINTPNIYPFAEVTDKEYTPIRAHGYQARVTTSIDDEGSKDNTENQRLGLSQFSHQSVTTSLNKIAQSKKYRPPNYLRQSNHLYETPSIRIKNDIGSIKQTESQQEKTGQIESRLKQNIEVIDTIRKSRLQRSKSLRKDQLLERSLDYMLDKPQKRIVLDKIQLKLQIAQKQTHDHDGYSRRDFIIEDKNNLRSIPGSDSKSCLESELQKYRSILYELKQEQQKSCKILHQFKAIQKSKSLDSLCNGIHNKNKYERSYEFEKQFGIFVEYGKFGEYEYPKYINPMKSASPDFHPITHTHHQKKSDNLIINYHHKYIPCLATKNNLKKAAYPNSNKVPQRPYRSKYLGALNQPYNKLHIQQLKNHIMNSKQQSRIITQSFIDKK